jgi:CelD/BcsL family acetyltransferase involved in cellulose biosynthesis
LVSTEVAIIRSEQEFAGLEEQWEELYCDSPLATPFQSWAWLYSWWEIYGKDYELWLITVRNDRGLLVGVVPLMLERMAGFDRLLFAGTGLTDHLDVLAREGWEGSVSEALARTLRRMTSWQVVDLQQLRPGAVAWGLLRWWDGPLLRVWQDGFPVVDVRPWDELLMSLSKNLRSTVRRTLRRAEADGVSRKLASVDDAEGAAIRLVALHRELWQERDIGSEHLTNRFESYVIAVARRMIARGFGGITEFWRDGEVVISDFWVCGHDFLGTYMLGANQAALQRYQWSSLYIWDAINIARSTGKNRIDLLRGEEPYKLRWSSEIIPNHRLILGRHWTTWAPYAGYHLLYSKTRRYANSESAPRWIKNAAGVYRILRREAVLPTANRKRV